MAKMGPNGLQYVLPNKKALPFTPGTYSSIVDSTPEGRMALRNSDFNSYMGDSAGAYSNPTSQINGTYSATPSLGNSGINVPPTGANYLQAGLNKMFGTTYGNKQGLAGNNYMFTGNDGRQGSIAIDPQYLQGSEGAAVIDAINNPTQEELGSTSGSFGNIAQGAQALAGLGQAYVGYKNYGLAKDMFNLQKATTNRNISNQASEYNTGIQNAGDVGMSLAGATMDANARAAYQAKLDSRKISTAPVG